MEEWLVRYGRVWIALLVSLVTVPSPRGEAKGFPWGKYARASDDWYRSEEARRIAENVLSYQSIQGSWPKNIDTAARPYTGRKERLRGTFDNGATRGEMRFLARVYTATKEDRYRDAFLKALDHILAAQYPNGGWPQYFPLGRDYPRHITFNDGAMVGLMNLMRDIATSDEFAFVDEARRRAAKEAFDRGIACILKCQIVVNGERTAWCAQHDEVTLEPRRARTYEHPSISGSESVGVVQLLMSVEDPSPEVIRAVNSACRWFETAKRTGIRQVRRDGDKVIVRDPDAPAMWARFYEIGTNRPIFSGRDGVIKYDIAEIESERRNGYGWYGDWPQEVLKKWPAWRAQHDPDAIHRNSRGANSAR